MSAFEVCVTHIDALVSAAARRDALGSLSWYHGEVPGSAPGEALPSRNDYLAALTAAKREVTIANAGAWGAALLAENRRSIDHRYAEEDIEAPYEFTEIRGPLDPVAILKALSCYEYQSCEHPGWRASEAHSFCEALRARMIRSLPGYDDAAWEVSDPAEVVSGVNSRR